MSAAGAVIEAVVMTGAAETPYRRAGRGPTALLLAPGMGLFEPLVRDYRVIEPLRLPSPIDAGAAAWLNGVVDGLGLDRPAVIAGPEWLDPLLRLAAEDLDRFGVVVPAGTAEMVRSALMAA